MTNEAIEAAARAIGDVSEEMHISQLILAARAAAPALMEEGARLALEVAKKAAYNAYLKLSASNVIWDAVDSIDPAAIVKGAGRDR